ncbi:TonB-dependent receptor [Terrimonas pollutisoli]|uniref:TonB-dependent receptor n=1 Tax=Terrimonas pollutisoli TaxID=3034147 RepID=UPI0023EC4654|nr:TonB-dependent receptor [Terrimonas sp. H1YJ31]
MRKNRRLLIALLVVHLLAVAGFAQSVTISGTIRNSVSKEPIPSVSVVVKGTSSGTYTNENGAFKLAVDKIPVTLVITSVGGFEAQEITVSNADAPVEIALTPASTLGQEVVVSASRTPERILESPVSIERVGAAAIRNNATANYYDIVNKLKGVNVIYSSLTYATPTTRGFSGSGNTRFNQVVNGMDNQAPGLNFAVGMVIGLTELDVDNMELLPGASSALYGPGGMNGTLLINGKNPFKYKGLSFQIKQGIMHTDGRQRDLSPYYNWSLRWAEQIGKKFAFKIGTELIQAKDWQGDDYRNYKRSGSTGVIADGTRETDPNYDGVNVYGDEVSINLKQRVLLPIAQAVPFWADYINSLPANIPVSRTGYTEKDVVNPNTLVYKLSGALHYKLTDAIEASLSGYWGTGNTVYTGSQRYSLRDLKMGQYKLELNHKNWFIRGYTTQENAGGAHNLTFNAVRFNDGWKADATWFQQYGFAYVNAKMGGRNELDAHNIARSVADQGRPVAGSAAFQQLWDATRKKPIPQGGLFLDRTDLYMVEGQYNFTDVIKVAEVIVGGNWKQYVLKSEGTLFAKEAEPIKIDEFGGYIQVSKEIVKDVLKLTASGRYDKNETFSDGRFTPRFTALIKPAKDHNIRLSYQTAYRFASTQQQWIDLDVVTGRLLGGVKFLWDKYNMINNPVYDPTTLQVVPYVEFKPESVQSYEIGYKTLLGQKLLVDAYYYFSEYKDFLSRRDVVQNPGTANQRGFSIVINSPSKVKASGWGLGLDYILPKNFSISANISSDDLGDVPDKFLTSLNTPKYRTNVSLSNSGFGRQNRLGFNVSWRWQDKFFYENDFASGDVPAYHTVDAQFSYRKPEIKSTFKIGASNLLNQYYRTSVGNPSIGGLYYISYGYNL